MVVVQLKGEMPKSLVTIEKAADYLEQAGSHQTKPARTNSIFFKSENSVYLIANYYSGIKSLFCGKFIK